MKPQPETVMDGARESGVPRRSANPGAWCTHSTVYSKRVEAFEGGYFTKSPTTIGATNVISKDPPRTRRSGTAWARVWSCGAVHLTSRGDRTVAGAETFPKRHLVWGLGLRVEGVECRV